MFQRTFLILSSLGFVSAIPMLEFVHRNGDTEITWDGTTLVVPQHCRQTTCEANINALEEQKALNTAQEKEIALLKDSGKVLEKRLDALASAKGKLCLGAECITSWGELNPPAQLGARGSASKAPWTLTVAPDNMFTTGGSKVRITGKNFRANGSTDVWFGAAKATEVHIKSDTIIECRAPAAAGRPGPVSVAVVDSEHRYYRVLANEFRYTTDSTAPPDALFVTGSTSVEAQDDNRGHVGGGYNVQILGSGFMDGGNNHVVFEGPASQVPRVRVAANAVTTVDDQLLIVEVPRATSTGPVSVVVSNKKGSSTIASGAFVFTQHDDSEGGAYSISVQGSSLLDGRVSITGEVHEIAVYGVDAKLLASDEPTDVHVGGVAVPNKDIRVDAAAKVVYFYPPAMQKAGWYDVSMVHGDNHFRRPKSLLYFDTARQDHTVKGSEAIGVHMRMGQSSRRRRSAKATPNSHISGNFDYQPLNAGAKGYAMPMLLTNDGLRTESEPGQAEFMGSPTPYALTDRAGNGFCQSTVDQPGAVAREGYTIGRCMKSPPATETAQGGIKTYGDVLSTPVRLDVLSTLRPGARLMFWDRGSSEWGIATVDTVVPNGAPGAGGAHKAGHLLITFTAPFACKSGNAGCQITPNMGWITPVAEFGTLSVPTGTVLTSAAQPGKDNRAVGNDIAPVLALDIDALKLDGVIDMSGTTAGGRGTDEWRELSRGGDSCGSGATHHAAPVGSPGGDNTTPTDLALLHTGSAGGGGVGCHSGGCSERYCRSTCKRWARSGRYYSTYCCEYGHRTAQYYNGKPGTCLDGGPGATEGSCSDGAVGGAGGLGGGVVLLRVKAASGAGRISADGGRAPMPQCSGSYGGSGSGGIVQVVGPPLDKVKVTANPGGMLFLQSQAVRDQSQVKVMLPSGSPYTWKLVKQSNAYCSYCTSCRFLESSVGSLGGQPCEKGAGSVKREASIKGGGCTGHCGCNVHNRIDYEYACQYNWNRYVQN
jgi:hypothetical protein